MSPTADLTPDNCPFSADDLPPDKDAAPVFYCTDPNRGASLAAAIRARELGYENVYRMPAGIHGWRAAKLPVERLKPQPTALGARVDIPYGGLISDFREGMATTFGWAGARRRTRSSAAARRWP